MRFKPLSFQFKLIISYLFVILISFSFVVFFLMRNLEAGTFEKIKFPLFFSFSFALGLAFVVAAVAAAGIIKPVNKIIRVSRKFSAGEFDHKIIVDSQDEIGQLANTLNKMAQDIEDKIKETREQNQKLSAVFESMIEGVVVVDKAGRIISLNSAVEKIFGVSADQAKGSFFLEIIRNADISEIISGVLKTGQPVSAEATLSFPVRGIFQINAVGIFNQGKISGCLAVIHDISQIRRLESLRRDLVANVSHELRTPLTSIKGFIETLLAGAMEDKEHGRSFLQIIESHVKRLDNLVNDLLSLSHLESGKIRLEIEEYDLRQQLDSVIAGFSSQVKQKNIQIKNDLAAGLILKADKNRIEQVLVNFIDNAVKFNRENGEIKIYSQDSGGQLKVVVEDSGIGIPQKDIPRIFERFYRVDKARSRQLGGTGLGLSIVKHIIELHGGSAGAESVEGLGSKFWFILPK